MTLTDHRAVAATALLLALAAPALVVGCEDQSDPKVYLGPVATSTFTAPPVYTPGTPTATPTGTGTGTGTAPVLVEPPPAVVAACPSADASGPAPVIPLPAGASASLAVSAAATTDTGASANTITLFAGSVGQTVSAAASCPAGGGELPSVPVEIADIGALVTLDARGLDLVAGTTALSARVNADGAETRAICALAGAKSVAVVPGSTRGFAVTGSATVHVLDWTSGACTVTPVELPAVDPDGNDVVGATAVVTATDGVPWVTTVSLGAGDNGTRIALARVRRFDLDSASFDDLAPVLGGQPGTICGADATAVSEGGERLAVLDGACGRLVVFDAASGELVSGASLRAKAIAPIPATTSFLAVQSTSGLASFHGVD